MFQDYGSPTKNVDLHRCSFDLYSAGHRSVGVDNMAIFKSFRIIQDYFRKFDGFNLHDSVGQFYNFPQRLDVQA